MAIQTYLNRNQSDTGGIYPEAYLKIENIRIDVARDIVNISVRGYADEKARNHTDLDGNNAVGVYKGTFKLEMQEFQISSNYDDIMIAGYEYLKSLDEFQDVKDV